MGYPTALELLAQEQIDGRLDIHPALAVTGGELASSGGRARIAASFGCPVRDAYAASEFMGIAFSCSRDRLHLNSDWVVLEPVDRDYRPVPRGERSDTVLLTNLVNRVQPLGPNGVGGEWYRVDFEVKTVAGGITETTNFERIDIINDAGRWILPTNVILDVAPIARATAQAAAAGGINPIALAQSTVEVALKQIRDISPIPIPKLPVIEQ